MRGRRLLPSTVSAAVLGQCNRTLYQAGEQRKPVPGSHRCLALHLYTGSRCHTCALLRKEHIVYSKARVHLWPALSHRETHFQRKTLPGNVSYFLLKIDFPPLAPLILTELQSREHSSHGGQTSYVRNCFSPELGGSDWTAVKSGGVEQKLGP